MREEFQSIRIDRNRCQGCMACLRICPTRALRVRNGIAILLSDRCIDCGDCVQVCTHNAVVPLTSSFGDFSRFRYTIALPSPSVYSQFGKDVSPAAILRALTMIGFDYAYDVACASESVSIAIQEYLDSTGSPRPLISPFCPAIVRLIQIRYPNLLENLIPIESPMEIAAREIKRLKMTELGLKEHEIGVMYITPCPAKMLAIKYPPRKKHSFVNGAIAISEIFPTVRRVLPDAIAHTDDGDIRGLGLGWPIVGGQVACLKAEECLAIGGLNDAVRIFEEIENGKLHDIQYIEVHSCPTACVGGSLTVENSYIARGRVLQMVKKFGSKSCQDHEKIRKLYQKNFFSLPGKIPSIPFRPLDENVSKALQKLHDKQQFFERLPKIDCAACGSPDCATFADDVVRGDADPNECVFLALKEFEELSARLLEQVRPHSRQIRNIGKHGGI